MADSYLNSNIGLPNSCGATFPTTNVTSCMDSGKADKLDYMTNTLDLSNFVRTTHSDGIRYISDIAHNTPHDGIGFISIGQPSHAQLSVGADLRGTQPVTTVNKGTSGVMQTLTLEPSSKTKTDKIRYVSLLSSSQVTTEGKGATYTPGLNTTVNTTVINLPESAQMSQPNKIMKVIPRAGGYKCVVVKDAAGLQKNCIVMQTPEANPTQAEQNSVCSAETTQSVRLALSVEQEISDMIKRESARFTLKGESAKSSKLLEVTTLEVEANTYTGKLLCQTCKEVYARKEGFQFHLQRISFVLKYWCTRCALTLTFFNKCALWAHLKIHNETIDYSKVASLDPFDFASNPNIYNADMSASVQSDSKAILSRVIKNVQGIQKCPICQDFVRNLPLHLKKPDSKFNIHKCHTCKISIPNRCSRQAHERLHKGPAGGQYCCPECGLTWSHKENIKDVFDHVDSCMHFNRGEAFSCECKASFATIAEVKKHYIEKHTKPLSKCSRCSVAFTDAKFLEAHLASSPGCKTIGGHNKVKVTCLCMLCKSVMVTGQDAKTHVLKHIQEQAELSWVCFLCSMMFPTAQELRVHSEEDHPHRAKRCTLCFSLFCNRNLLVEHIIGKSCPKHYHSLSRCVDMPPRHQVDLETVFQSPFKTQIISQTSSPSQPLTSTTANHQKSPLSAPSSTAIQNKKTFHSLGATLQLNQTKMSDVVKSSGRKIKVAIRRPATLDNQTSELLTELEQWMSEDGREITPTTTPPSQIRKKGRPKNEKRPPQHLICGVTQKGLIYQCHPCKIIISGTNNYISHMKYHETKGDCSYGPFCHCSVCDKLISTTQILAHLKEHQNKGIIVCCRCQRRDFGDLEDAIQHGHNLCEYKRIGSGSGPLQSSGSSLLSTNLASSTTKVSVCESTEVHVDTGPVDTEVLVETTTVVPATRNTLHPCHLCGLAFENIILRDQHARKAHGGTRKIYHCLACERKKITRSFTSQVTARKHVTKKHRVVQRSLVDKCLREVDASVVSDTKRASQDNTEGTESRAEGPAPKRLRISEKGDFLCGKCGFSCPADDKESFSKHITSHNLNQEPQCPECGLCFTVLAALKKHLFAVHKIKSVDSYMQLQGLAEEAMEEDDMDDVLGQMLPGVQPLVTVSSQQDRENNARREGADEDVEDLDIDDDIEGLECNVCYRSFDTEINLKTHMRTHGMAFIRSKRFKPI